MNWENWIAVRMDDDLFECTPVEIEEDGSQSLVIGMCLITGLDDLIDRGAKRVVEVTNTFEPKYVGRLHWSEELPQDALSE